MRENIYDGGQPEESAPPKFPPPPESSPPRKRRPPRDWNTPGWRWTRRIAFVVVVILGLAPYVVSRIFDHVVATTPVPDDVTLFWIGHRRIILARCLTLTCAILGLLAFWLLAYRLRPWIRYGVMVSAVALIVLPKLAIIDGANGFLPEVTLMARVDVADGQVSIRHYCHEWCPFICKNKVMTPVIILEDRRAGSAVRSIESVKWQSEVPVYGLCGRLQASKVANIEVRLAARPRRCADHTKEEDEADSASGLIRYSLYSPERALHLERGYNAEWCRPQWPVVRPIWPIPTERR